MKIICDDQACVDPDCLVHAAMTSPDTRAECNGKCRLIPGTAWTGPDRPRIDADPDCPVHANPEQAETWEKGRREGSSDYPLRVNGHTLAVIVTPEERIVDQIVADHTAARALEVAKKALRRIEETSHLRDSTSWRHANRALVELALLTPSKEIEA